LIAESAERAGWSQYAVSAEGRLVATAVAS
jgi:hypothetical protein